MVILVMRLIFASENTFLLKHLSLLFKYTKINHDFLPVIISKCPHAVYHSIGQSKAVVVFFTQLEQSYILVRTKYSLDSWQCIVPVDLRRQKKVICNLAPGTVYNIAPQQRATHIINTPRQFDLTPIFIPINLNPETRIDELPRRNTFTSFFSSEVSTDSGERRDENFVQTEIDFSGEANDENERFACVNTMKDVVKSFFFSLLEWSVTDSSVEFFVVPVREDNVKQIHDAYVECFAS